eukprot:568932-Prorocentrum_minimum.AAC.3
MREREGDGADDPCWTGWHPLLSIHALAIHLVCAALDATLDLTSPLFSLLPVMNCTQTDLSPYTPLRITRHQQEGQGRICLTGKCSGRIDHHPADAKVDELRTDIP